MKNTIFITVAAVALFMGVLTAKAGEPLEQPQSNELRIERLEKIVARLPKISGFVNLRYQYSDADGDVHSFDVRRARLDFKGDISKNFDYRLQVEFAGSPRILDAYMRWKINPYFNVQGGQYKINFSLENTMYGPHQLETTENSTVISRLSAYNDISGISSNGRDIGFSFYGGFFSRGDYNLIDYAIGLFNGNGINNRDNNNSKDFSGIVSVNPSKHLTFAVSHYNGSTYSSADDHSHQRVRTGVGARYDDGKLLVRSEYIRGKTSSFKSEGVYAVAAFFAHPKWQPLVKYDYFRENTQLTQGMLHNYIAGINYFPIKYVRLQLNYTYRALRHADNVNLVSFQVFGQF